MKKVLYVKCNARGLESSRSLVVSEYFLEQYKENNPDVEVEELDIFDTDIPRLDKEVFAARETLQGGGEFSQLSSSQQGKLAKMNELIDQFMAADRYIFSFPMWNLSCPADVKNYIDNVTIVGKTFHYTPQGAVGLLNDKDRKAVVISSYGGFHAGKQDDFCIPYVENLLKFLGIEDVKTIVAQGVDALPDQVNNVLEKAKSEAQEIIKDF